MHGHRDDVPPDGMRDKYNGGAPSSVTAGTTRGHRDDVPPRKLRNKYHGGAPSSVTAGTTRGHRDDIPPRKLRDISNELNSPIHLLYMIESRRHRI